MEIKIIIIENVVVVRLKGELDDHTVTVIREKIDEAIKKNPVGLLINLNGLSFMDSSGVGMILGRYNKLKKEGKKIAVCCADNTIKRICLLAGITSIIDFFSSEEKALAAMGGVKQ